MKNAKYVHIGLNALYRQELLKRVKFVSSCLELFEGVSTLALELHVLKVPITSP